jgi:murein DD-endopeptidase MepM/ murein hydrolase activator NlpD
VGLLAGVYAGWFAGTPSGAQTVAALRVEAAGAPQRVQGSDGREHIEYDLIITNAFTAEATLSSLEVRVGKRRLLSLTGRALAADTLRSGTNMPTDGRVGAGSTVVLQVDIVLPRSAGRRVPALLGNRLRYALPANAPARAVIGATTIAMPPLHVDKRAPVVIAAPLRGAGWLNGNGCCNDPTSPHRQTVVATSSGGYSTPEMFAIDYVREVNGRLYTGDGLKNSDWPTFGAPVYAVANGTIVLARNTRPDIPPKSNNLDLRTPDDFGGNRVILRIGTGQYACYAHLERGSVRVHPGQRVRMGQRIGIAGNSGNTNAPHLHFGIQQRPDCLSESDPFQIDRYTLQGEAGAETAAPNISLVGPRGRRLRSLPLIRSVAAFSPPARHR